MSNPLKRRVTWVEIVIAAVILALVILAEKGAGGAAQASSMILKAIGAAFFFLFAVWFSRAVYLSVRGAPDYALFGYSMLAFCLVSWGLAFFYPFPIRRWQDLIYKDLAFYAGAPAPLVLLILLAVPKLIFSPEPLSVFRERMSRLGSRKMGLLLAAIIFIWFFVICALRITGDIQDLRSGPLSVSDIFLHGYHATRMGDDTLTFSSAGTLKMPHGLRFGNLESGRRYQILYTPNSKILIGLHPEP